MILYWCHSMVLLTSWIIMYEDNQPFPLDNGSGKPFTVICQCCVLEHDAHDACAHDAWLFTDVILWSSCSVIHNLITMYKDNQPFPLDNGGGKPFIVSVDAAY